MGQRDVPDDLIAITDGEADQAALQAQVRAAAGANRPLNVAGSPHPEGDWRPAGPWLHPLHATAEVRAYAPVVSHTPVVGPALVHLRRAVRRGLRWYLWPAVAEISAHNLAVADAVAQHRRELTHLRLECERLDHDLVAGFGSRPS